LALTYVNVIFCQHVSTSPYYQSQYPSSRLTKTKHREERNKKIGLFRRRICQFCVHSQAPVCSHPLQTRELRTKSKYELAAGVHRKVHLRAVHLVHTERSKTGRNHIWRSILQGQTFFYFQLS
jgi:hypothetical protein